MKVAVLCSGGGTNLQALLDAERAGAFPHAQIALVGVDRDCYARQRAAAAGVPAIEVSTTNLPRVLEEAGIDVVVLAGFLAIVPPEVTRAFAGRIINIHPSLLPAYGGKGMYGLRVHEAVLAAGETRTGATVHLVTDTIDGGEILLQREVDVEPGDTAEILQARVMKEAEWKILPQALAELMADLAQSGKRKQ
ncbi:phosphoribosylglycinamide formyltransferase [Trueperella pecoris]|uniref:Phosphoribosylglycinamide formyltransferase n=1 Tax=Trueperella pecoris TaxID=2733571 RepID=A0A7M1QTF0_9ACTO|nr:phosphoribosylglycinamide formyltransferase [Trueperella pecoris]QOR45081.1 phosphoribosylglycinamide formyltransferase [Trueperella pecoris]